MILKDGIEILEPSRSLQHKWVGVRNYSIVLRKFLREKITTEMKLPVKTYD